MVLIPIRSDSAYFGFAKQSAQGIAAAPTIFPRWLDGSIEMDMKAEDIWEGDGSRRLSQVIKNGQSVKIKVNFHPRPLELAFMEHAVMGSGSDAVGSPLLATTTTTAIIAATSTTVTLTSVTGLGASGVVAMALEPGTSNEEIALFQLPATGNVLTLVSTYNNGSGKFALAHSSSVAITTSTPHVLTDKVDGDYHTIEVCLGGLSGGAGPTLRVKDCKCESVKVSGKSGSLIAYEIEWYGIATTSTGTPATVTLEAHSPFFYTSGTWTLNGAMTGDAQNVESFDIQRKNALDMTQTENLTMAAIIFGNLALDVGLTLVMVNAQLIALTYFGSTSGTTDTQAIGSGALNLLFTQADTFHTVQYSVPTMHYTKTEPPAPKKDGKHFMLSVAATGVSNQGASAYLLQTTVNNTQTTAY
jgi:hypothetical protein